MLKKDLKLQIRKKLVELRAKTYSYLKENNKEDIKKQQQQQQKTKNCVIKRDHNLKDYNNHFRASQIENIINYLEKKEIDVDCLKKKFIKNSPTSKTIRKKLARFL